MKLKLIVQFFCCINCHCLLNMLTLVAISVHFSPLSHKLLSKKKNKTKKKRKQNLKYNLGWRCVLEEWQRIKMMAFPHWTTNNHQSQTAVTSHHLTAWVTESGRAVFLLFRLNIIYIIYFFFYFARDIRSELIEYVYYLHIMISRFLQSCANAAQ